MGMSSSAGSLSRLNIEIGYTVDKTGLQQIQQSLQAMIRECQEPGKAMTAGFKEAGQAAQKMAGIISASTNMVTGELDMGKFSTNMKNAGVSMKQMQASFSGMGLTGTTAFSEINEQLLRTHTSMTKLEGFTAQLGKTFMNTFLYSFSYRIVGSVIQGISDAISYVKDLDKSLTDIAIVTKESSSQMDLFAKKANEAARNLGTSTKAYADASLIFAQQGLKGEERDVKTETTMKVANVTGEDAAQVSQELTALWNGYQVSTQEVEASVDKLANVAAHSASNLSELSTAMTKVASAANTMGVSEDQLVAQLATIESVTRQAPESIGTALKTIYARMGDLSVEGADEFGVSLGKVSSQLQTMGIDILDQEGNMREMGVVMEDVADKWQGWTQAQKQAAAVAMAGKRQYPQLIALMENWDKYQQNLDYSKNSEGEVEAQQEIYLNSVKGLQEKAKASWENVYSTMFDSDTFKQIYKLVAGLGDAFAGMGEMLPIASLAFMGTLLKDKIAGGVANIALGMSDAAQQTNAMNMQTELVETASKNVLVYTDGHAKSLGQAVSESYELNTSAMANLKAEELMDATSSKRLLTNEEIVTTLSQNDAKLNDIQQKELKSSIYQNALAKSKKETLEMSKYLSTEEQEQLQLAQEKYAEEESNLGVEMAKLTPMAQMLGFTSEELETIMAEKNGEQELVSLMDQRLKILNDIDMAQIESLEATDNELSKDQLRQTLLEQEREKLDKTNRTEEEKTKILRDYEQQLDAVLNKHEQLNELTGKQKQKISEQTDTTGKAVLKRDAEKTGLNTRVENGKNLQKTQGMLTGITSVAFGATMALSSVKSAISTLNDSKATGLEKVSSVLMALAMAGTSVKQAFSGVKTIIDAVRVATQLNTKALAKDVALRGISKGSIEAEALAEATNAAMKSKSAGASKEEIAAEATEILMNHGVAESEAKAAGATIAGNIANTGKIAGIFKSIPAIFAKIAANEALALSELGIVGAIIAVVAILAIGVAALVMWAMSGKSAEEQAKDAKETYHAESEALKQLTDNYDELKESMDGLKDKYAHLDSMTKGTKEWREEVMKLNSEVISLIDKYPELAQYVEKDEDGVMRISEEGYDEVLKNAQQGILQQEVQTSAAQANMYNKQADAESEAAIDDVMKSNKDFAHISSDNDEASEYLTQRSELSSSISSMVDNEDIVNSKDVEKELGKKDSLKNIDFSKGELAGILEKVEQIRILNDQELEAAKQTAAATREANNIKFAGKGADEEEKERNSKAKEGAYDAVYAQALKTANDNWEYDGDDLAFNAFSGADTDEDITGENAGSELNDKKEMKEELAEQLGQDELTKEQAKLVDSWKDSDDINAKHWLAEQWGVKQEDITYDEDSHTFKDSAGHERAFEDQEQIARYVDDNIKTALVEKKVDKSKLDALSTDQANIVQNVGKKSTSSFDVEDMSAETLKHGMDKETKEALKSAGYNDKQIKDFNKKTQQKYDDVVATLDGTTQKVLEKNKQMTIGQARAADQYIKQENALNAEREGTEEKASSAIKDLYEKNGQQATDVTNMLQNVNWSEDLSVEDLKKQLMDLDIDPESLHVDSWKELITTMSDAGNAVLDLDANMDDLISSMDSYIKNVQDLKAGDEMSADDYQKAYDAAQDKEAFEDMFMYNAKKDKYIVKATDNTEQDLKDASIGKNAEQRIADMDQKQTQLVDKKIGGDKKGAKYLSEYKWDEKDEEKNKKTAKDIIKNADAEQIKLFEADPRYTELVKKLDKNPDAELNSEELKVLGDLSKTLQNLGTTGAAGGFDTQSSAYLSTTLQSEYKDATSAYVNAETKADELGTKKGKEYDDSLEESTAALAQNTAEALDGSQQEMAAYGKEVESTNKALQDQDQAIKNVAIANQYGLQKSVEKLSTLWNDTYKDAKKGTADWNMLLQESADTINTQFGSNIDQKFVEKHQGLIKKVAKGDKDAIKKLQRTLAKQSLSTEVKATIKKKNLQKDFDNALSLLQGAKVEIGAGLNKGPVLDAIKDIIKSLNLTEEQANKMAASMKWKFKFKTKTVNGKKVVTDILPEKNGQYGVKMGDVDQVDTKAAADKGAGDSKDGGGDSGNTPNYTYETTDKNDIDHLHDLKQAMEDLNSTFTKLKNQQDKVFGKSLIKNLNDQNKLIEKQNKNLKDQIKIQTKDLGQSQTDMKKLFGFKFNSKGRIKNYKKILNERYNAYADYIKKYNKLSAKQQEGKTGKTLLAKRDKAKTKWDEAKNAVSEYDTLYNERQANIDKTIENFNTIAENNIKKLHAMAEALELTTQLEQNALDYEKDIEHSSKDRAYQTEYNLKTSQIEQKKYKENLKEAQTLQKELEKMTKKGWSKTYGTNFKALTEALAKSQKALFENLKKIQQGLVDDIKALSDNYKDFNDEIEKVDKTFKHLTGTLDTYNEIAKMLYGEDEYGTQSEVAQEKLDLYKGQTQVEQKRLQSAKDYLQDAEAAYQSALKSGSKEALQTAEETLQSAKEAVQNAENAVNEAIKNQIKSLQEWYTAQIKSFFADLEKATTGGYGWDYLSTSMKRAKQYSDDWLDDVQRIGNMSQLTASFEQEMAKAANSSASAQQKILQCKNEQLAALEKIDKLTQYDIDRAKAKLSLTLKQIALEEARENKSKLRLKRDSQGNYSYQYSADVEAIAKAKEEYEAARLKLNEEDQKNFQASLEKLANVEKEGQEALAKLYEDLEKAKTQEEKDTIQRKIEQTTDYYSRQRGNTKKEVDRYRGYVEDSSLSYFNQKMGTNYGTTEEATQKDKESFYNFLYGSEGTVPLTDAAYKMMNQTTDDWRKNVKQAIDNSSGAYQTYGNKVDEISNSVNGSLRSIIEGVDEHSGLINTKKYTDELNASVDASASKYKTTAKRIQTNINKQSELFNTLNSKAAKAAIKKPAKMADNLLNAKANAKALYEYINNNKDLAITPMEEMSSKARQLRDDWNGVYKAAKKAIAQESKSKGAGSGSGGGGNGGGGNGGSDDSSKGNGKKVNENAYKSVYKITKSNDGTWAVRDKKTNQAVIQESFSSKKAAQQAAKSHYSKYVDNSNTDGKITKKDKGKLITAREVVDNKSTMQAYDISRAGLWRKATIVKNQKSSNLRINMRAVSGQPIKDVKDGKVLIGGKKGQFKDHWYNQKTIEKYYSGFDTGGYTGAWNNKNGKLALLHEKEIVLNKQDTANFLQAVKLTRMFAQDLGKYKTGLVDKITAISNDNKMISSNNSTQSQALQQDININATFPNASSSSEIEKAFQQLSAKATQYAWSNKIK